MTSKPDFFQNCLIAAPELEIQKTPPCALKEISSFFMQFFFCTRYRNDHPSLPFAARFFDADGA